MPKGLLKSNSCLGITEKEVINQVFGLVTDIPPHSFLITIGSIYSFLEHLVDGMTIEGQ